MKCLKKIRLINWHFFRDHTIETDGNILLTGENGSGKSTLLDAIQFVLTAGKAKFNIAANTDARRSLESYMRGKTGKEGTPYLRNGDVISQIALEYYDEETKESLVLGTLLELSQGGKARKRFYVLHHCGIIDSLFLDRSRRPLPFRQFQSELKAHKINYEVSEKQMESQSMFRNALGVAKKYHLLLPKALAFQPINDLNKFIFDFLLNEDPIQLDGLRENIRQYRHLEVTMKEQKKQYERLSQIMQSYENYQKYVDILQKNQFLIKLIQYQAIKKEDDDLATYMTQLLSQMNFHEEQAKATWKQKERIEHEYFEVRSALYANEGYRYQEELTQKETSLKSQMKEYKSQLQNFYKQYEKELKILVDLRQSHRLPLSKDELLQCKELPLLLEETSKQLSERKQTIVFQLKEKQMQQQLISTQLQEIQTEIKNLENKQFTYSFELQHLMTLLEEQLFQHTGEHIEIRPFCEYLEINDETWRNAIEGYLNTQRFDLIIEPQHFNFCARIYERYKEEQKIYGVGIVNTARLKINDVKEHTLASKVDAINPYARAYANMLMNKVDLEEDIERIKEHKIAITPTCMIYRNVTLRSIHPKVYQKPFIGQQAIVIQLKQKKEKAKELQEELKALQRSIKEFERQLQRLNDSNINELTYQSKTLFVNYLHTEQQLQDVSKRLKQIKKDASWITLEEQVNHLNKKRSEIQREYDNYQGNYQKCKYEYENAESKKFSLQVTLIQNQQVWNEIVEKHPEIVPTLQEESEKMRKNTRNDYKKMENNCHERIRRNEDACYDAMRQLKDDMYQYNKETSMGYAETLEDMPLYQNQYHKLKDIELDETLRKINEAQRKAEISFQEDFISRLREKIKNAKKEIKQLNETLKARSFNGERYEFIMSANQHPDYKPFYEIIMSGEDFYANSLFMEELNEHNRNLMQKLFNQLSNIDSDGRSESLLSLYTDYRQYLNYDIKIHHKEGGYTLFSKVSKEKSGGETQTPYYVTIAASFEQLLSKRNHISSGCLVMLDEAFNNMDESRIEAMMQFYRDLNIQLLIAVPPSRIHTIAPYADSILTLVRKQENILVGNFAYENS